VDDMVGRGVQNKGSVDTAMRVDVFRLGGR
jgi:hypothetical protein